MTSASIYHAINWLSTLQFTIFTIVCGIIGFLGAQICMTENKHFVTEAKWQESREELIDRINNVDSKHTINYGKLSEKIAEGNAYQKQSYEVQKIQTNK